MRMTLIIIQAAILTFVAVIGAQGETGSAENCSLSGTSFEERCDR